MSIRRRPSLATIPLRITIVLLCLGAPIALCAQAPSAAPATPAAIPSEHPITLEQLRIYTKQNGSIEPMRKLTLVAAEQQRKTLPPWFPPAVWDDVEKKMLAVDIPPVLLPVYQRYMSTETADALILFYSGPLGEKLAEHFTAREADSASKGTSGEATSAAALNGMLNSTSEVDLAARRMKELTPEEQARVLTAKQAVGDSWKTASNQLATVYDNYMNDVVQAEIKKHNAELVAAKTAYLRKSSATAPAQK